MLDEYRHIVSYCFEGNTSFELQRAQGFEAFVNFEIGQFTVAEILATYTDNILRKNGLKLPLDQFEAQLEKVVKLFAHLTDKDIFIESFKNFMAKRLLSEKSESIDYERCIVTKLKVNCGRTVTDSIEGMMSDLELAKDHAKKYAEHKSERSLEDPIDFDIKILTTSYWPTYKSFELSVPAEIKCCMDSFTAYYTRQQQNHHRELKWNFAMGTAIVAARLPGSGKPYDLVVSTYQMCVLYLFNYQKELTIAEVAEHMGFDEETAKKNMQSLMTPKARMLIHDNGKFKVNPKFNSPLRRVNFPVPMLEESVKKERITQDRSHAVDAALVRIMKSRKQMKLTDLRLEVVTLMQTFKPDDALIKKRLESLIEREYMEREKNDPTIIVYKA